MDMRGVCDGGALALSRLHSAVEGGSLPRTESGMGPHLYDATSLRGAASMAVAFLASAGSQKLRSTSEVMSTSTVKNGSRSSRVSARRITNSEWVRRPTWLRRIHGCGVPGEAFFPDGYGFAAGCGSFGATPAVFLEPRSAARFSWG